MIRDPEEVKRLAAVTIDENYRLRSLIKMLPRRRQQEINRIARDLGEHAAAQMDCRTCGACCRENWIPVNDAEADRLARRLNLPVLQFRKRYLSVDPDDADTGMDAKPCAFLTGTTCSVYEDRPQVCCGYPYVGGDIASRMLGIIERAGVCPIIFEMLEGLKRHLRLKALPAQDDAAAKTAMPRRPC